MFATSFHNNKLIARERERRFYESYECALRQLCEDYDVENAIFSFDGNTLHDLTEGYFTPRATFATLNEAVGTMSNCCGTTCNAIQIAHANVNDTCQQQYTIGTWCDKYNTSCRTQIDCKSLEILNDASMTYIIAREKCDDDATNCCSNAWVAYDVENAPSDIDDASKYELLFIRRNYVSLNELKHIVVYLNNLVDKSYVNAKTQIDAILHI